MVSKISFSVPFADNSSDSKVIEADIANLNMIGFGRYGNVYFYTLPLDNATDSDCKRLAIKTVSLLNKSPFHLKTTQNEIIILEKIRNRPNLLVHLGSYVDPSFITFTSEFIPGENLWEGSFEQPDYLSIPTLLSMIKQASHALHALRELNIVHGDIAPTNMMFDGKQLKIVDFGLAIDLTQTPYNAHLLYNSQFRPPEVILRIPFTDNTPDVHALGLSMLTLFAKRHLLNVTLDEKKEDVDGLSALQERLGPASSSLINKSPKQNTFFSKSLELRENTRTFSNAKNLEGWINDTIHTVRLYYDEANKEDVAFFSELMRQMITWDPVTRISPKEIMEIIEKHPIEQLN